MTQGNVNPTYHFPSLHISKALYYSHIYFYFSYILKKKKFIDLLQFVQFNSKKLKGLCEKNEYR